MSRQTKTALNKAFERLSPEEQAAVRKLWRLQKQIEKEARKFRKRNIIFRF